MPLPSASQRSQSGFQKGCNPHRFCKPLAFGVDFVQIDQPERVNSPFLYMTDDELREDEFPENPGSGGVLEADDLADLEEDDDDGFSGDDEDPEELDGFRVEGGPEEEERDF